MEKQTGRIEAFSDGVIGIAMTLLVIELKVPEVDKNLLQALAANGLVYLSFIVSFFYILIMWVNHHRLFKIITKSNDTLLMLNGLLLLGICGVPFMTDLLSKYLGKEEGHSAGLIYGLWFFGVAIVYNLLWGYAYAGKLFHQDANQTTIRTISRQYIIGPVSYLIMALLALISPYLTLFMSIVLAIYFAIPNQTLAKVLATDQPAEGT